MIQPPHVEFGVRCWEKVNAVPSLIIVQKAMADKHIAKIFHGPVVIQQSEPTIEWIEDISSTFGPRSFGQVIGIGGGSAMDVAKYYKYLNTHPVHPIRCVTIPTIPGSGAESSQETVAMGKDGKVAIFGKDVTADQVFIDPTMQLCAPIKQRILSCFDMLAACAEVSFSPNPNPIALAHAEIRS